MNITIAIDSLKGSLSSLEAGHAIEEGIRRVYKDAAVNVRPLPTEGKGPWRPWPAAWEAPWKQ